MRLPGQPLRPSSCQDGESTDPYQEGELTCISHTDILAKASPANGQPYSVVKDRVTAQDGCVGFEIPT